MNAISGPTMCLACVYCPPAEATVDVTSRVDHRNAGVKDAREPAGDQGGIGTAFADGKVPTHVFTDQHDADAQGPDMGRAKDPQKTDFGAMRPHAVHGFRGDVRLSVMISPSVLFRHRLKLAFARRGQDVFGIAACRILSQSSAMCRPRRLLTAPRPRYSSQLPEIASRAPSPVAEFFGNDLAVFHFGKPQDQGVVGNNDHNHRQQKAAERKRCSRSARGSGHGPTPGRSPGPRICADCAGGLAQRLPCRVLDRRGDGFGGTRQTHPQGNKKRADGQDRPERSTSISWPVLPWAGGL